MDAKRKSFLDLYKDLCNEFNMYIGIGHNREGYGDAVSMIDDVLEDDELTQHFKEIEEN